MAMTDWKTPENLEDYAHFRAELVELSPESFTLDELRQVLDDMIESKVAIEDGMREHFATPGVRRQGRARRAPAMCTAPSL